MADVQQWNLIEEPAKAVSRADVHALLQGAYPAWLLNARAEITAVNLLCAKVWDSKPEIMLGRNAYEVFYRSFVSGLLPRDENDEMLIKKHGYLKRLREAYGDTAYLAYIEYFNDDPSFMNISDLQAPLRRKWEFKSLFDYPMRVLHREADNTPVSLYFAVKVRRIEHTAGFLTTYEPADDVTKIVVAQWHEHTIPSCDIIDSVQYKNDTVRAWVEDPFRPEPMEKEARFVNQPIPAHQQPNGTSDIREQVVWDQTLTKPDVTLRIGATPASKEAFEILDAAGITCEIDRSNRRRIPSVAWGGLAFRGTTEIKTLANMLNHFEETLLSETDKTIPDLAERGDPDVVQEIARIREEQRFAARTTVYQSGEASRRHKHVSKT